MFNNQKIKEMKATLFIGFILSFLLFVGMNSYSQSQDRYLDKYQTEIEFKLGAGDTATYDVPWRKIIGMGSKKDPQLFNCYLYLKDQGADTTVNLKIYDGIDLSDTDSWTANTTIAWANTTTDTSITVRQLSTPIAGPYMIIQVEPVDTTKVEIDVCTCRFYNDTF